VLDLDTWAVVKKLLLLHMPSGGLPGTSGKGIPHQGYAMQKQPRKNNSLFAVDQSSGSDSEVNVGAALAAGGPHRVGWFRYYFDEDRWEWSPQVEKMHGYLPGSITPTTEMVLAHKHPDDYQHIAHTLQLIRQTRQAFSSRHRIIDVQGRVHHVVVVGDLLREDNETVIGTHGFYIDVTPAERARQDQLTAAVARFTENRSAIEQTKGMLMLLYGINESTAFQLLKWRSQEANVKLRPLAVQIATEFLGLSQGETLPPRSAFDNILLSAHLRIDAENPSTDPGALSPSEGTG
jgi:PAS domain S-box-containing protein